MERVFRFFGIVVLVAVLCFSFVTCDDGEEPPVPYADFLGKWAPDSGTSLLIEEGSISVLYSTDDLMYKASIEKYEEIDGTTEDYPEGFSFEGKITQSNIAGSINVGGNFFMTLYISIDKNSLLRGSDIYYKQGIEN